ncbi:KOW domain-containing RNA-binding protein [Paenibacillus sp. ACRRX]|uniref:KOW domain-containing RNA-binding protein n=1 Tax=unclassified Paenibacillus TaxID=185978 RepID=UPI001EF65040|nr:MULTISPECIES: KOW domain-containing RNA-binding protein [unclassified Paenibacillus]MCG7410612.1 KOW domain-containing RNA-binding protein [Paenibacillus sp. ACRRX]MDK8184193.1 KOW domain-containing RNA-binding protein [Paenibacillus sp. UMB4589-SE434]
MSSIPNPQLGQFVKVLQGRGEGKLAIIVGVEPSRYVNIADGDKRKFDQPKRKNLLHLELHEAISHEVVDSLKESGRVTNSKLRYVIAKYTEQLAAANGNQKGE